MSASNYAKCPRCQRALDGTVETLRYRIVADYGKIPASEYSDLQGKLDVAIRRAQVGSHTFREDYEIYGAETGTVTVSYGGSCSECGLELSFEDSRPIPGALDEGRRSA